MDRTRRRLLRQALITVTALPLAQVVRAAGIPRRGDLAPLLRERFGDRQPEEGGIELEVSQVVENGNSVAVTVRATDVDPPPRHLYLFMPRNPEPFGARFTIAAPALPEVSTRVRLSATQNLTALAEYPDGRLRGTAVSVLVTLGACIDDNYAEWIR
ncbi:MAG: thiosulfate oxidation carrier protein SoxY [Pseudomonadales bacterium]|jgi:sulfur-oxidizing protein SoxY|nr:thiosulfate oxidation carrier protein SoxY [Pseudomonadales bacterium]